MTSGRIVAELGRPETAEETAARKARESRLYRERKTLSNLLYALIATIAAVIVIVLAVPQSQQPIDRSVDPVAASAGVAAGLGAEPLLPNLTGSANVAELRTSSDGIVSWTVGWVTPDREYLSFVQAVNANPSWVASLVADAPPSGTRELNGREWLVYDNRERSTDVGNARYALVTEFTAADGSKQTVVLLGTSADDQFVATATELDRVIRAAS